MYHASAFQTCVVFACCLFFLAQCSRAYHHARAGFAKLTAVV